MLKNTNNLLFFLEHKLYGFPQIDQTINKNRFKDFDWTTTEYLATFAAKGQRNDLFFQEKF